MEKSYHLCDAGDKIVLRRLTEPDYEMRTVLVADSLISIRDEEQRELHEVSGQPFFVLKLDDSYFVCWERRKNIQISDPCNAFLLVDNNVLLQKGGCWYWWHAEADVSCLYPLGKQISCLGRIFVFRQAGAYLLNYFEAGKLKTRSCLNYEILNADFQQSEGKAVEFFPDILSISDEKGISFLSVESTSEVIKIRGWKYYKLSYAFQFKEESSDLLIKFAKYVRQFCERFSNADVYIANMNNVCDYVSIRGYLEKSMDYKVSLNINLRGKGISCASVIANLSKLYRGENGAYQINCTELEYYEPADDVWLENSDREKALLMRNEDVVNKISCSTTDFFSDKYLVLSKNV